MKKFVICLLLVILLSISVSAEVVDDLLIVPGQRIGTINLGMTLNSVLNLLGKADVQETYNPVNGIVRNVVIFEGIDLTGLEITLEYNYYGLSFSFDAEKKQIDTIRTWNGKYETKDGLRVGSYMTEVFEIHPARELRTNAKCYYCGSIAFAYDDNGKVKKIAVY